MFVCACVRWWCARGMAGVDCECAASYRILSCHFGDSIFLEHKRQSVGESQLMCAAPDKKKHPPDESGENKKAEATLQDEEE
mmetsp:Transcript_3556/g.8977  ORF Transcript_3556/g.8977 Transcript_3556/m.8977 type:complete len:82 (+) Transcript_3556:376-621(+)